jgi:hypothetical protein
MKSVVKPVPVSANKINELKPIIIPIPTLIPNPHMSSIGILVNKFLVSSAIVQASATAQTEATVPAQFTAQATASA